MPDGTYGKIHLYASTNRATPMCGFFIRRGNKSFGERRIHIKVSGKDFSNLKIEDGTGKEEETIFNSDQFSVLKTFDIPPVIVEYVVHVNQHCKGDQTQLTEDAKQSVELKRLKLLNEIRNEIMPCARDPLSEYFAVDQHETPSTMSEQENSAEPGDVNESTTNLFPQDSGECQIPSEEKPLFCPLGVKLMLMGAFIMTLHFKSLALSAGILLLFYGALYSFVREPSKQKTTTPQQNTKKHHA